MMQHDQEHNSAHNVGLQFAECDVGAQVSSCKEDEKLSDCVNALQVSAMTEKSWQMQGHEVIYTNVFADNQAEFEAFSQTVVLAMKEGVTQFGYRQEAETKRYFSVACTICGYFLHTWWRKGGAATRLRELWWAWLKAELPEYIVV